MKIGKLIVFLAAFALISMAVLMPAAAADNLWNGKVPPAVIDGSVVVIAPGAAGTLKVPDGATVTVTGEINNTKTGLVLDIGAGGKVLWQASLIGEARPLLRVTGTGTFQADPDGWIWNTGSGVALLAECNEVIVTGDSMEHRGIVEATSGSAIEGAGLNTVVTMTGTGLAVNEAKSNINPVINMANKDNTGDNVIIEENAMVWTIASANRYAYGIQTYGDVSMTGGDVYSDAIYGRAINLVGPNSRACITGGIVHVDGANGVAISTATTDISGVPANQACAQTSVVI
ncbi:MAG: hypothetical protein LBU81_02910 [Methanosarcinales archaeon]|jgi:hypothetical protein|nr:hypothetical protein [Methanosarcinales archaeon]